VFREFDLNLICLCPINKCYSFLTAETVEGRKIVVRLRTQRITRIFCDGLCFFQPG
jgi:hypothetical protein